MQVLYQFAWFFTSLLVIYILIFDPQIWALFFPYAHLSCTYWQGTAQMLAVVVNCCRLLNVELYHSATRWQCMLFNVFWNPFTKLALIIVIILYTCTMLHWKKCCLFSAAIAVRVAYLFTVMSQVKVKPQANIKKYSQLMYSFTIIKMLLLSWPEMFL